MSSTIPLRKRAFAEFLGTFFLVLIGPGSVAVNAYSNGSLGQTGIALAFALVLFAIVYVLGPISGAHCNPAVTFAMWSLR